MKYCLAFLCLLEYLLHSFTQNIIPASEFQLEGDYLIGGLFDIHHVSASVYHDRPEAIDCTSQPFLLPNYRRFQMMRFSVEEINNSTNLLPNVSLGYEMFDHCSDTQNFPGNLKLLSVDGLIQPWDEAQKNQSKVSKVISVVGPFTSTQGLTVAPLFMVDLIPMVSYGSSSSVFSKNFKFPSFLRTVHPNKDTIEVIVNILQHFNWRWVAFLNSDNDFGIDGRELFIKRIKDTEICLAYTKDISINTNYYQVFNQIEAQKIHNIIVFAPKGTAEAVIDSAIQLNITNKVWIADDGWSLNKRLPKEKGIDNIGTVLGVSQPVVTIPGFSDFIYASKSQNHCENAEQQLFCNQVCNCSNLSAEDIIAADPSFSFPVYSAVYAIAHALHNTLQCGSGGCNGNITVYPHMVLAHLKKSNFTLLNQSVEFDENGDPKHGSYSIVFWNHSGDAEEVGFYNFHPSLHFFINNSKIQWYTKGEVPTSLCSQECPEGYAKKQDGIHKCCFKCEICPNGTYVNSMAQRISKTEWAISGGIDGSGRPAPWDGLSTLPAFSAFSLPINYNTPGCPDAGWGPMFFLILSWASVCVSLSGFFTLRKPTTFVFAIFTGIVRDGGY
ncbi:LOW QUALITY PROTEIN: taste receptor type 1 member 1-like [Morone saxatilis]|uniref:LOW QUALITY PROTEIN: taste receptor type 1 member 1-like n=1 Tax=Morone saxatilis TaxID=34816 RepID=UPI0015E1C28D|nr:LOW QUALITY PROTEIN: taste receptor type 1 member 1-like [Morone saxatilis]